MFVVGSLLLSSSVCQASASASASAAADVFQTNVFKTSRKSRLVVAVKTRNGTVAFYHDFAGWQTETLGLSHAECFIKHLSVEYNTEE